MYAFGAKICAAQPDTERMRTQQGVQSYAETFVKRLAKGCNIGTLKKSRWLPDANGHAPLGRASTYGRE